MDKQAEIELKLIEALDLDVDAYLKFEEQREKDLQKLLDTLGDLSPSKEEDSEDDIFYIENAQSVTEFRREHIRRFYEQLKIREREILQKAAEANSVVAIKDDILDQNEYQEMAEIFDLTNLKSSFYLISTLLSVLALQSMHY